MAKKPINEVMQMVADDCEADARKYEGAPFDGRTVAAMHGETMAMLRTVALAVRDLSEVCAKLIVIAELNELTNQPEDV